MRKHLYRCSELGIEGILSNISRIIMICVTYGTKEFRILIIYWHESQFLMILEKYDLE